MGVVYHQILSKTLTVEVDDRLKPFINPKRVTSEGYRAEPMEVLTIHLYDFACMASDYGREDIYYDEPSKAPCHRRLRRAAERFEALPKHPVLGVVATMKAVNLSDPPTGYAGYEVHAKIKGGSFADVSDPGPVIGFLRPNFQKRTRRKWILTNESMNLWTDHPTGGEPVKVADRRRVVYTHGTILNSDPVIQHRRIRGVKGAIDLLDWTHLRVNELVYDDETAWEVEQWTTQSYHKGTGFYSREAAEAAEKALDERIKAKKGG